MLPKSGGRDVASGVDVYGQESNRYQEEPISQRRSQMHGIVGAQGMVLQEQSCALDNWSSQLNKGVLGHTQGVWTRKNPLSLVDCDCKTAILRVQI